MPPPCDFDHVVINFTTVVKGRQFDRTGVMYLGDNEVWRTSTAEPTSYGIRWEWLKDMTPFVSLWKQPQISQYFPPPQHTCIHSLSGTAY